MLHNEIKGGRESLCASNIILKLYYLLEKLFAEDERRMQEYYLRVKRMEGKK